tara:strand:- start:6727 stop:7926 length:1200 start_codon:yes stop_codon:yes gene_type:complete
MTNEKISKVATQVGVTEETLESRMNLVLEEQSSAWAASGKSQDDIQTMALRVAARQLVSERARVERSGCTSFSGMFVSVPPYKDWARIAYNKMKNTLAGLDDDGRTNLVASGAIILYENNHDGTWTKTHNPSLSAGNAFEHDSDTTTIESLPAKSMTLDENTSFSCVWDKNNPTFPSGDRNWKYGAARPLEETDRTCKFIGTDGSGEPEMLTVRLSGDLAKIQFPTFTPGVLTGKAGKNSNVYGKAGVTSFEADASVASLFSGPPLVLGDDGPEGIIVDLANEFLPGLHGIGEYHDAHREDSDWWSQTVATVVEVVHIDPLDNGGYTITVGDLDIMSDFGTLDFRVPKGTVVDFGVGSQTAIIGAPWKTSEGDYRFTVHGFWVCDTVAPATSDATGWDE